MKPNACCVRRVVGGERARDYCYESEPMSTMRYNGSVCGIASGAKVRKCVTRRREFARGSMQRTVCATADESNNAQRWQTGQTSL
jgi:hypothetical protein